MNKPHALMMKTLYSLILQAGERPDFNLTQLTYEEAKKQIDILKKRVKEKDNEFSSKDGFREESIRIIDPSDNRELDWIGNQLSLFYFGRPCKVPIEWDKALKNAAGLFMYDLRSHKPIRIIQSMWQYNQFGAQHVIGTLKHELAHYHLFMEGKPFRDGELAFQLECQRIGAPLFALAMQEGYETICSVCGKYLGLEKKERKKQLSRCCKKPIQYGSYVIILPNGTRVEVEK